MKIKRVKPAQTKEQQADTDGWVYVTRLKSYVARIGCGRARGRRLGRLRREELGV
jgi:hypothetical protein